MTAGAFGFAFARAAVSPVVYLWWPDFYLIAGCIIVYGVSALHLSHVRFRNAYVAWMLILSVMQVLIGMRQFTVGDDWMPFGFLKPDSGNRASGMFISSIHLAGFLEVSSAFAISMAIWSEWRGWARCVAGYIALLCYVGIAITGSRGGYVSTASSLLVFVALSLWILRKCRPDRFRAATMAAAFGVTFLAASGIAIMSQSPVLRQRLSLIGKADVRVHNWRAALDQFATSPLIGTGAGTHLYFGRLFRRPEIQTDPVHAHSDYLELLAEYGIIGFATMMVFLVGHIASSVRSLSYFVDSRRPDHRDPDPLRNHSLALQVGALSACAAYLVHSAVDFNLHIPANAIVMAFVFSILANPRIETIPEAKTCASGIAKWLLSILGLVIAIGGLPKLPGEYWNEKARVALRDSMFQSAVDFSHRALKSELRNPDIYFHLGEANRALAMSTSVRALRQPFLNEAVKAYQAGLEVFPQDENLWVRLGQALDGMKRFSEAENAYRTAIELDPNLGVLYAYYAAHLNARGRTEEADQQRGIGERLSRRNLAKISEPTLPPPTPEIEAEK